MSDVLLPLSICLEDTRATPQDDRYMQCVALVGRKPGLVITTLGKIGWRVVGPVACELWRTADGELALFRPEDSPDLHLEVRRAGRSLLVPCAKPVILRHRDELRLEDGLWIVHIHGPTRKVVPPSPLRRNVAATLAAIAVAVGAPGCDDMDVRDNPPSVIAPHDAGYEEAGDSAAEDATAEDSAQDSNLEDGEHDAEAETEQ